MKRLFFVFLFPFILCGCGEPDNQSSSEAQFQYITAKLSIDDVNGNTVQPDGAMIGCVENTDNMTVTFRVTAEPNSLPDIFARESSLRVTNVETEFEYKGGNITPPTFSPTSWPFITVPYNNTGTFALEYHTGTYGPFMNMGTHDSAEFKVRFRLTVEEFVKSSLIQNVTRNMDLYIDRLYVKGKDVNCGTVQ